MKIEVDDFDILLTTFNNFVCLDHFFKSLLLSEDRVPKNKIIIVDDSTSEEKVNIKGVVEKYKTFLNINLHDSSYINDESTMLCGLIPDIKTAFKLSNSEYVLYTHIDNIFLMKNWRSHIVDKINNGYDIYAIGKSLVYRDYFDDKNYKFGVYTTFMWNWCIDHLLFMLLPSWLTEKDDLLYNFYSDEMFNRMGTAGWDSMISDLATDRAQQKGVNLTIEFVHSSSLEQESVELIPFWYLEHGMLNYHIINSNLKLYSEKSIGIRLFDTVEYKGFGQLFLVDRKEFIYHKVNTSMSRIDLIPTKKTIEFVGEYLNHIISTDETFLNYLEQNWNGE